MLCVGVLLLFISSCYASSLQFIINQRKTECFYVPKEKGERLEAWFEVADGKSEVNFAVFDDKENIIEHLKRVKSGTVNIVVNKTADYAFCFGGRKIVESAHVFFDFNPEIESTTHFEAEQKFSAEKRKFLNKVLHNVKFDEKYKKEQFNLTQQFMMDIVREHKEDVVEQNPNSSLENSLLYLSILADRMQSYLEKHKIQMRRHYHLQTWNAFNVNFYSIVISCCVIVAGLLQIVVVKSFFTGSLSWKVWQF